LIHNPETIDRLLIANSRFPSTRVLLRLVEEVLNLDKPFGDWRPDNLGVPTIGGSFYRCISIGIYREIPSLLKSSRGDIGDGANGIRFTTKNSLVI
jgi:hypothetical protein